MEIRFKYQKRTVFSLNAKLVRCRIYSSKIGIMGRYKSFVYTSLNKNREKTVILIKRVVPTTNIMFIDMATHLWKIAYIYD